MTIFVVFVIFFSGFMYKLHKNQGSYHLMERDINENQKDYIERLFKYADEDTSSDSNEDSEYYNGYYQQ